VFWYYQTLENLFSQKLMDTAFLRSFLLTVDTGSMAEAARRLGLTPAAVSQQIRSLERELGAPLVARAGRTVRPTDAGYSVLEHSRAVLRELNEMAGAIRGGPDSSDLRGALRIGAVNTALHTLVPDILVGLAKAYPNVNVFVKSGSSMELFQLVQQGELDAAVSLHPQFTLPKTVSWLGLREEKLVVLAPRRLARHDPHEVLRTQPFIRYDRSQWGGQLAERYLQAARIIPQERFELSHLAAIAAMVDRGLGVSLAPDASIPWAAGLRISRLCVPLKSDPARLVQAFVDNAKPVGDGAR
jgi:DNA-binding transcriptional LysR family regulator